MNWIIISLQGVLLVVAWLGWRWLRDLPSAIHRRQEKIFSQQLSKELELLKISHSQIQLRKIDRFIDFAKLQQDIFGNEQFKKKIAANDPKTVAKLKEAVIELGIGLFFFASDDTVRKYGEWKRDSAKKGANPLKMLDDLGELMVALRRDVGYTETTLTSGDYLRMFVTDWDEVQGSESA